MKSTPRINPLAVLALALAVTGVSAAQSPNAADNSAATTSALPAGTIEVITSFDYPSPSSATYPQKINDRGAIVGDIHPSTNFVLVRGFVRLRNGRFSPPLLDPNSDRTMATNAWGVNNARLICGDYQDSSEAFHGYLLSDGVYSTYDVPDAISTSIYGVNDQDDFCGSFSDSSSTRGFFSVGGVVTIVDLGGDYTSCDALNNAGEIVGTYDDSNRVTHGYFRDAAGNITAPIDAPGSAGFTSLRGINDHHEIVGRYWDSQSQQFGFLLKLPNTFITFSYTGASQTALNGINNSRLMCGYYTDSATRITHGVIARLH